MLSAVAREAYARGIAPSKKKLAALKRLASAVRFRPWPPSISQSPPETAALWVSYAERRCARSICEGYSPLEEKARSPEKAGVGGSIPSLATINFSITTRDCCALGELC